MKRYLDEKNKLLSIKGKDLLLDYPEHLIDKSRKFVFDYLLIFENILCVNSYRVNMST